MYVRTYPPDDSTTPNPAADTHHSALPDHRAASLDRRCHLNRAVVKYRDGICGLYMTSHVLARRAYMRPLVNDTSLADVDGP